MAEKDRAISAKDASTIRNKFESRFALAVIEAGYQAQHSPPIVSPEPVEDRFGRKRKTVTKPDLTVIDPQTPGKIVHVEVSSGKCNSASKQAQRRVAERAGVRNYVQVSGKDINAVAQTASRDEKRSAIAKIFGW